MNHFSTLIAVAFAVLLTACAGPTYVYRDNYRPLPINFISEVDVPKPISKTEYLSYACTKRESENSILIGKLYDTIALMKADRKSLRELDASAAAAAVK